MRLRTTFGFERFMATKKSSKKTEAPVEEAAAPVEEKPKAKAKAKAPAMKVGLEHMPDADTSPLELKEFIVATYHAALGRDPLEAEMKHHLMTVELHRRPRADIHIDLRKSGEFQGRHYE